MNFFQIAFLIGAFTLAAAEQGSPEVIHWKGEKKVQTVQETGKLEVFQTSPESNTDTSTSALRLAEQGKRYIWLPSGDRMRGAGGARIPDAAVSADRTALFLLETVGADEGPFDTRLVILDTQSGKIIRVQRFSKVRYVRILTIPDTDDILLAEPPVSQQQQLVRLDPVSGKIRCKTQLPVFSDWMIMKGLLLIKDLNSPVLHILNSSSLASAGKIKTAGNGGKLLPESDSIVNNMHPAAPAKLERISLPGAEQLDEEEMILQLPPGFTPVSGLFFGTEHKMQLWMEPDGAAMLRQGKNFHNLTDRVNGLAAFHDSSNTLLVGLKKRDMLAEFKPFQSTKQLRTSLTGQLKPLTRGECKMIFCTLEDQPEILVLDHRANFFKLLIPAKGRQWKKVLLFTPGE